MGILIKRAQKCLKDKTALNRFSNILFAVWKIHGTYIIAALAVSLCSKLKSYKLNLILPLC